MRHAKVNPAAPPVPTLEEALSAVDHYLRTSAGYVVNPSEAALEEAKLARMYVQACIRLLVEAARHD